MLALTFELLLREGLNWLAELCNNGEGLHGWLQLCKKGEGLVGCNCMCNKGEGLVGTTVQQRGGTGWLQLFVVQLQCFYAPLQQAAYVHANHT